MRTVPKPKRDELLAQLFPKLPYVPPEWAVHYLIHTAVEAFPTKAEEVDVWVRRCSPANYMDGAMLSLLCC